MPRVVSLVPSMTETALGLGLGSDELVGRTSFCVHPRAAVRQIPPLGGTKTPRLRRILQLAPDLVLMDRDENRREDADVLRQAGIDLFVADVAHLDSVEELLLQLGERLGRPLEGKEAAARLAHAREPLGHRRSPPLRALPLVWHQPLMAVAPDSYCGALLREAGFEVPRLGPVRYPAVDIDGLAAARIDLLLLPDEPHRFTVAEGEALQAAIAARGAAAPLVRHLDGKDLFWYGVRTPAALGAMRQLARLVQAGGG